jgi:cysteine-S-conjugate beta-lyase
VVFDLTLDELRRRRSVKWRFKESDVLPLWVAEMDVRLAEPIRDALAELVERSDTGYVTWDGLPEAFAAFAARRWQQELDPGRVFVVPDVMRGIFEVLLVATEPGDQVVINPPVYAPFFETITHSRRRLVEVPLVRGADGPYQLDVAGLERAFAGGARAYLLCSPHNPVGRVWTRAELQAVAAGAEKYGVLVLVDEIHGPLVYEPHRFVPFATLDVPAAREAISFVSASKAWNLAGLKCALAVAGSAGGAALLAGMGAEVAFGAGLPGAVANTVAFDRGGPWLDELLVALHANRDRLGRLLAEHLPSLRWRPEDVQATYLAWLDCSPLGLDDPAGVFERLGRVALEPGPLYGTGGDGFVRLNFATSAAMLDEAVRRMRAAIPSTDERSQDRRFHRTGRG